MTGWIITIVLALAVFGSLWPFVRGNKGAIQFLAAALLLALAGYSLQGRPGLEGQPKPPPERKEVAEEDRPALLAPREQDGREWRVLFRCDRSKNDRF